MPTQAELGWMAAVIDLRGRVYVKQNRQRATRQIVLMVESTRPAVIRKMALLTGTNPEARSARPMKEFMRRACNEHCIEPHVHVNDEREMPPVQRWTATGVALAVTGDALLPFLAEDLGLPEFIAEICGNTDLSGRGSGAVMATLLRMKDLGWPMPPSLREDLQFQLGFHELAKET